jgi:hypothetical protein
MGIHQATVPKDLPPCSPPLSLCSATHLLQQLQQHSDQLPANFEEGLVRREAQQSPEHEEDGRSAVDLLRPPPRKRKTTVAKTTLAMPARRHSPTPLASSLHEPTLYTHRRSGFPHPSAAEVAAEDEETADLAVARWNAQGHTSRLSR